MQAAYLDTIARIERLHREFLEVVKLELDSQGVHGINAVQAMILFNLGNHEMSVTELTLRGCYIGSNVSYNLKKLGELGYLVLQRAEHDRRVMHVRLSENGHALREKLLTMHERHLAALSKAPLTEQDLNDTSTVLQRLDRFWARMADSTARRIELTRAAE